MKTHKEENPLTYAAAGVDIDAGTAFVEAIKGEARRTHQLGGASPLGASPLGGFGGVFDLKEAGFTDPILIASTDGVGTKLEVARLMDKHRGLGVDLVAMCVNDVLAHGAMPLFFLDYFATSRLEIAVAREVIAGIADACVECGCNLIGGETAEMPNIYPSGGYDLAGFCVGAVERGRHIDPARTRVGDVAVAVASTGVHANGFSLIRRIVAEGGLDWHEPSPFTTDKPSLGEALLTPTRLYPAAFAAVVEAFGGDVAKIHGLAHITGGGLIDNPPRGFGDGLRLEIDLASWQLPPVFQWLKNAGRIEAKEMARVFNCGIGLMLYVAADDAETAINALNRAGFEAWAAGRLVARTSTEDSVILTPTDAWENL